MENRTNIDHVVVNEITSKIQLKNGDDQSYLNTNGSNERSNLTISSESDSNDDGRSNGSTTSSDVQRNLSSNRRTPTTTTDVSLANLPLRTEKQLEGTNDVDPLLDTEIIPKPHPPIAHPEIDDDEPNDDSIPNTPENHPGIDDGFLDDIGPNKGDDVPDIGPRVGGDDEPKRPYPPNGNIPVDRRPSFNDSVPAFNSSGGIPQNIPDVNVYQHKKTLAQGMMDLALLSANANQLRYVLESYNRHPYYYFSLVFISVSIILQIAVGVGLIWNSQYNVKKDEQIHMANRINNFTVLGIFLITIVNVFIASFGVADPPVEMIG